MSASVWHVHSMSSMHILPAHLLSVACRTLEVSDIHRQWQLDQWFGALHLHWQPCSRYLMSRCPCNHTQHPAQLQSFVGLNNIGCAAQPITTRYEQLQPYLQCHSHFHILACVGQHSTGMHSQGCVFVSHAACKLLLHPQPTSFQKRNDLKEHT